MTDLLLIQSLTHQPLFCASSSDVPEVACFLHVFPAFIVYPHRCVPRLPSDASRR